MTANTRLYDFAIALPDPSIHVMFYTQEYILNYVLGQRILIYDNSIK